MATNILVSASPGKILTLLSKFRNVGALNRRFKTTGLKHAENPEEGLEKFRCRDVIKLIQMDETFKLTKPGMKVLDLGAAPGSWSQYLAQKTNATGKGLVVAMDINNFESIKGVRTLPEMDFLKESSQKKILEVLGRGQKFDCIFSDMIPPPSVKHLKQGGSCVIKLKGAEEDKDVRIKARKLFKTVKFPETKITARSAPEVYLIGTEFLGMKT